MVGAGPETATPPRLVVDDDARLAMGRAVGRAVTDARLPRSERRRSTLVMLSGGVCSTAVLVALLRSTHHFVQVHHVELGERDEPWVAERADAADRVVAFCGEHYRRNLNLTTSRFVVGDHPPEQPDASTVMITAARVVRALGGRFDLVATGHDRLPFLDLVEPELVFNAWFSGAARKPRWMRPLAHLQRRLPERRMADARRSLPDELVGLTVR